MTQEWSGEWCSCEHTEQIESIAIVFDETPHGIEEACCIIQVDDARLFITVRGKCYESGFSGFIRCNQSGDFIIIYKGLAAVVDINTHNYSIINIYPCFGPVISSNDACIVHSHKSIAVVRSTNNIMYNEYKFGEIEKIELESQNMLSAYVYRPDIGKVVVNKLII